MTARRHQQLWLSMKMGEGILVCLQTGRILSTLARDEHGWVSRTSVRPLFLLWMWRHGLLGRHDRRALALSRNGLHFVSRHPDMPAVCQSAEFWSAETLRQLVSFSSEPD